jgi:exodeoxyribonuclease-3
MQELKLEDAKFPALDYSALGYEVATFGQKTYNGVAILSRTPMTEIERGFNDGVDDQQARFLAATIQGVRVMTVYVPNGQAVGTLKFTYKLEWYERFRRYLVARAKPENLTVVCGDFNVAPEPVDVYDPIAWEGRCLFSLEERDALKRVRDVGFVDVLRKFHPTGQMFSFWDYQMLAFPRNKGLRIDHIYASPALAARATSAMIDREARKGQKASDHAPVVAEFDLAGPAT